MQRTPAGLPCGMPGMGELMEESLAMKSVYQPGSNIPVPADPARAAEIKQEMVAVMATINRINGQ